MSVSVRYDIRNLDLRSHEFVVRMTLLEAPPADALRLVLPAWIPGSYMIRDFARNITDIAAVDDNGTVNLAKLDKQTWEVPGWQGVLQIDYRVYAFDLSVRSAFLDDTRGFFNGTSLFLRPETAIDTWEVSISRPDDSAAANWSVLTTLPSAEVDEAGWGRYAPGSYAQLIDCPVELGEPEVAQFNVDGVPHRFAVSDGGSFDFARICRDVEPICAEHAAMFGELPIQQYLFLTLATADGYGGLEHRDSTSLICKRNDLPAHGLESSDKDYRNFLGLCSHEYFHLWNVKRIRPEKLRQSDLSAETHTELLWAFEGITSYYDDLALARSGTVAPRDYLETFATTVTRVLRGAGRFRQSIAASSFDAWTKFYKQDENAPNAIVSYYAKGALVAFGLDITLRLASDGACSLDDLMRRLWQRFGKPDVGVPERGIEREAAELLGSSLDEFFTAYVYGTDELPLDDWFAALGIGWRLRPAANAEDTGGYRDDRSGEGIARPALGARFESKPEGLRLTHVFAGSAAQAAGLAAGDLLIAAANERLTASNLAAQLQRAQGETIRVHYFRRGLLHQTEMPRLNAPHDTCELWFVDEAALDATTRQRRQAWLASNRRR